MKRQAGVDAREHPPLAWRSGTGYTGLGGVLTVSATQQESRQGCVPSA